MNILPDPRTVQLQRQIAHEYYWHASEPLYKMLARIEAVHVTYRMTLDASGAVVAHEKLYDPGCLTLIQDIDDALRQCMELAVAYARNSTHPQP